MTPQYEKVVVSKMEITTNEREILQDNGSITAKLAKELAEDEFDKYQKIQDEKYLSDFDNLILKLEKK